MSVDKLSEDKEKAVTQLQSMRLGDAVILASGVTLQRVPGGWVRDAIYTTGLEDVGDRMTSVFIPYSLDC